MIHSTKPPTTPQTGVVEPSRLILSRTPFCGVVDGLCGVVDGLCGVVGGLFGVIICGATYDLIGSTTPQNTQEVSQIEKCVGYLF